MSSASSHAYHRMEAANSGRDQREADASSRIWRSTGADDARGHERRELRRAKFDRPLGTTCVPRAAGFFEGGDEAVTGLRGCAHDAVDGVTPCHPPQTRVPTRDIHHVALQPPTPARDDLLPTTAFASVPRRTLHPVAIPLLHRDDRTTDHAAAASRSSGRHDVRDLLSCKLVDQMRQHKDVLPKHIVFLEYLAGWSALIGS